MDFLFPLANQPGALAEADLFLQRPARSHFQPWPAFLTSYAKNRFRAMIVGAELGIGRAVSERNDQEEGIGSGTHSFCPRIDIKEPQIKRANKSSFRTTPVLLQQGRITEFLRGTSS
jgi:hypothetical protein